MLKSIIILISILTVGIPGTGWGWACPPDTNLVVLSPQSGLHTMRNRVAIRGYLCQTYNLVLVKNETTEASFIADTERTCSSTRDDCVYTFMAIVDDLAIGSNELTARILNQNAGDEVHVEVVRTALASLFGVGPF